MYLSHNVYSKHFEIYNLRLRVTQRFFSQIAKAFFCSTADMMQTENHEVRLRPIQGTNEPFLTEALIS